LAAPDGGGIILPDAVTVIVNGTFVPLATDDDELVIVNVSIQPIAT
jgi:hypothetical protein